MKVICFGDSNTYGYDPRSYFGSRYDSNNCWVDILAEKTGWDISNLGENGREIPEARILFPDDMDLLIIMLGTNDLLQSLTPEDTAEKMARFLTFMSLEPKKIVLIAPVPMILGEWVPSQKLIDDSIALTEYYRVLATQMGLHFVNPGDWKIPMAFDGVHFTEEGHRIFANQLYDHLIIQEKLY